MWSQVGGVLVERTCAEVLPAVKESLASVRDLEPENSNPEPCEANSI